jgi:hypothetical protein
MVEYGAINAANLDGGSSSTMIYEGEQITRGSTLVGARRLATAILVLPPREVRHERYANRRPGRGFRTGFIIYILLLLVIFAAALFLLRSYLARFQQEKDEAAVKAAYELTVARAPQRAFELFLEETAPEDWRSAGAPRIPAASTTRRACAARWSGCSRARASTPGRRRASPRRAGLPLKNGDLPLAEVTLSGGGTEWTVETVEMLLRGTGRPRSSSGRLRRPLQRRGAGRSTRRGARAASISRPTRTP